MKHILQEIGSEAKYLSDMINMRDRDFQIYFADSKDRVEAAIALIKKLNKLAAQLHAVKLSGMKDKSK